MLLMDKLKHAQYLLTLAQKMKSNNTHKHRGEVCCTENASIVSQFHEISVQ